METVAGPFGKWGWRTRWGAEGGDNRWRRSYRNGDCGTFRGTFFYLWVWRTIQQSVLNTVVLFKYLGRSSALYDKTMYLAWRRTIIYTKAQADNLLPLMATIHHLTSSNIWHTRSTKDIVDQSTFLFEIMPLTWSPGSIYPPLQEDSQ